MFNLIYLIGCFCLLPFTIKAQDTLYISTAEQLAAFARDVNGGKVYTNKQANAVLTQDIFLNDTAHWRQWHTGQYAPVRQWTPIGTSDVPFKGVFDGQGYSIYGLYINRREFGLFQGLFGVIGKCIIRNVHLKASSISGCQNVGGLTGYIAARIGYRRTARGLSPYHLSDSTIIYNCSNEGTVYAERNNVGGIVGFGNCMNILLYNCGNKGYIQGKNHVGGICGYGHIRQIRNCYNGGNVFGLIEVGGICGTYCAPPSRSYMVANNYNTGTVKARLYSGGIIGRFDVVSFAGLRNDERHIAHEPILFANCYNAGVIECSYHASGDGLVGIYRDREDNLPYAYTDLSILSPNYDVDETLATKKAFNYRSSPNGIEKRSTGYMQSPSFVNDLNRFVSKEPKLYRHWQVDSLHINGGFPLLELPKEL